MFDLSGCNVPSSSNSSLSQMDLDYNHPETFSLSSMDENYLSDEFFEFSNEAMLDLTDETLTATDTNSNQPSEEVPFDPTEWLVQKQSTNRTRPPKLYEFLHLLLNNLRYMSYASWLNKNEGLFQIHKPNEVCKLWEQVKLRHTSKPMTFDNFSRSIRYYYASGQMIPTFTPRTYCFAIDNSKNSLSV